MYCDYVKSLTKWWQHNYHVSILWIKKLGGRSVSLVARFTSACKNIMRGKKKKKYFLWFYLQKTF